MVTIFMISAKMATLGLVTIMMCLFKSHEVIIFVHDVTNRILSRNLFYVVDLVIEEWSWFKVSLRGDLGSSFIIWDWH